MPSLNRYFNHITERSYSMEHAFNETDKAITFTLSNQLGTISIKANGANEDDALANLVDMLRNTVNSFSIDAEVFNY
jgi:hypothetical protein